MKWSWKVGEFGGIAVYIHATFLLIILWVVSMNWHANSSWMDILNAVIFILALFGCVLLHEFGHALAARQFGISTRDITLYPIGGIARLERMPEKPAQELWVAIAGPLVNVAIAGALFIWVYISATLIQFENVTVDQGSMAERLMFVNILLVLFNLIPAFPMDGGRVLRALLAMKLPYDRATSIASYVGQGMAMIFGIWGIYSNPMLIFIALFVWIGASQESSLVQIKYALRGIPVRDAMLTDFVRVSSYDNLGRAVELILAGSQHDFPVVDDGRIEGVLTRSDLMHGLEKGGKSSFVRNFMTTEFQTVEALELLDVAFQKLQSCKCHTMPVLSNGQLVGLLTTDNIGEFMMIQQALRK